MPNNFNFEELASNPSGDLELTKHLYETGLQNVFNDYQNNVATLSQAKQTELQDAHYIREMSKKYLGAYASNNGVGDVSGNLLDIYGAYQKNVGEIERNYNALEMNLNQEYQQAKQDAFNNIMTTQYNMEVAKLDEQTQQVIFDIQSGEIGNIDPFDYLEQNKDKMSIDNYRAIYGTLYAQQIEEISRKLESGFYGYDDSGQMIEDPNIFLSKYRDRLNAQDYKRFEDQAKLSKEVEENNVTEFNVHSYKDPSSEYYMRNFDPSYSYNGDENIGKDSDMFVIDTGDGFKREYVQILDDVNNDMNANEPVDSDTLHEYFENSPQFQGKVLGEDTIIDYRGTNYVRKNNAWYRLIPHTGHQELQQIMDGFNRGWGKNQGYEENGLKADTLKVQGITYEVNKDDSRTKKFKDASGKVLEAFKKYYGEDVPKNTAIYFEGEMWAYDGKYLVPMIKKQDK